MNIEEIRRIAREGSSKPLEDRGTLPRAARNVVPGFVNPRERLEPLRFSGRVSERLNEGFELLGGAS